jgi:hypothetical protein
MALKLEGELAKAKDAELMLRREFEQQLAEEKKDFMAKSNAEVEKLHAMQDTKNKKRDAKV